MAELRDQLSQYIGFEPNEIRLLITKEDRQVFHEIIADQKKMTDIVMDNYQFLLQHGHNACTASQAEKILINPPEDLPEKLLAHIEKRFKEVPLAPGKDQINPSQPEVLPAITALKNVVHDREAKPNSFEVLEGDKGGSLRDRDQEKIGRKKLKSKSALALPTSSTNQQTPTNLNNLDINKEELDALYEKMVKKSKKNIANVKNILKR
ncbi:30599_t:CDS:2 [Gigaspora margarita]|uniref:30599_t:CDS:1 n=1 Tax=Gigaspora margarita TaxID=4874 RepID=A0ABN7VKZ0_GIGMA|nr:30599_t:CDS:2 [Gigaspora margarita]